MNKSLYTNNRLCAYCLAPIDRVHGSRKYCLEKFGKKDYCKIGARQLKENRNIPNFLDSRYHTIIHFNKLKKENELILKSILNTGKNKISYNHLFCLNYYFAVYDKSWEKNSLLHYTIKNYVIRFNIDQSISIFQIQETKHRKSGPTIQVKEDVGHTKKLSPTKTSDTLIKIIDTLKKLSMLL